jgi:hypothetical protein
MSNGPRQRVIEIRLAAASSYEFPCCTAVATNSSNERNSSKDREKACAEILLSAVTSLIGGVSKRTHRLQRGEHEDASHDSWKGSERAAAGRRRCARHQRHREGRQTNILQGREITGGSDGSRHRCPQAAAWCPESTSFSQTTPYTVSIYLSYTVASVVRWKCPPSLYW